MEAMNVLEKVTEAIERVLKGAAPGKTVAEPWSEEFRASLFLARAMSAAQHPGHHAPFFDADLMTPMIANEAYVRTLEQTARMFQGLPEASRAPPAVTQLAQRPRSCTSDTSLRVTPP